LCFTREELVLNTITRPSDVLAYGITADTTGNRGVLDHFEVGYWGAGVLDVVTWCAWGTVSFGEFRQWGGLVGSGDTNR